MLRYTGCLFVSIGEPVPYKQPKSPYWWVNRTYKGVGRVQKSAGTSNRAEARKMESMLDRLYTTGKGKFIEELRNGLYTLPWLYTKDCAGELETMVTSTTVRPFDDIVSWVRDNKKYAATTKSTYLSCIRQVTAQFPGKTVHDMPQVLRDFRGRCLNRAVPITRSFNQTRSIFQAYTHAIDGKYKHLWTEITNVPPISYDVEVGRKLSYVEVRELTKTLMYPNSRRSYDDAAIMWTLVLTGFRKSEYTGSWDCFDDRIAVECAKQRQSRMKLRTVPLLRHSIGDVFVDGDRSFVNLQGVSFEYTRPIDPGTGFQSFERRLRRLAGHTITPHDFRHTYRRWLELAGVPAARIEHYMGHKVNTGDAKLVYAAYDEESIQPFVGADAALVNSWMAAQEEDYRRNYNRQDVEFHDNPNPAIDREQSALLFRKTPKKRAPRPRRAPTQMSRHSAKYLT
jgi:integrase